MSGARGHVDMVPLKLYLAHGWPEVPNIDFPATVCELRLAQHRDREVGNAGFCWRCAKPLYWLSIYLVGQKIISKSQFVNL